MRDANATRGSFLLPNRMPSFCRGDVEADRVLINWQKLPPFRVSSARCNIKTRNVTGHSSTDVENDEYNATSAMRQLLR